MLAAAFERQAEINSLYASLPLWSTSICWMIYLKSPNYCLYWVAPYILKVLRPWDIHLCFHRFTWKPFLMLEYLSVRVVMRYSSIKLLWTMLNNVYFRKFRVASNFFKIYTKLPFVRLCGHPWMRQYIFDTNSWLLRSQNAENKFHKSLT